MKKLSLTKETLQVLETTYLQHVQGGKMPITVSGCMGGCTPPPGSKGNSGCFAC